MKILTQKSKSAIVAFVLVSAIVLTSFALPAANAHTPPWQIPTYAYITASPNPIGVGQQALVVFWIDKLFDPAINLTNDWRFHNYKLTITAPDGSKGVRDFPTVVDTTSVQTISYVPDQVGTYNFKFEFPGQNYNDYSHSGASVLVNDTFLASSAETKLIVQQEPVPTPIGTYPLPTTYWTRPIYGENPGWYTISSNWLGTGAAVLSKYGSGTLTGFQQGSQINRYPGDAIGPVTSHVMWTKPLESGGVVGGNTFEIQGNTYFEGSAYNARVQNPIIINGKLYYNEPRSFTGGQVGPLVCVDLRTGKLLWSRFDIPTLSFGYIFDQEDPNQHGVYPPILATANFARLFDAETGDALFNVTGVPTGMVASGPRGEQLRYVITNLGTTANPNYVLAQWNSSKLWNYQINPYTQGTMLSPSIINMTGPSAPSLQLAITTFPLPITGTTGTLSNGTVVTVLYGSTLQVNGGVFDSSNPQNRYDWNVSIPWRNSITTTGSDAPTVLAGFYNDMMLVRNVRYPILSDTSLTGIVTSTAPYTYYAINLNASRGQIGSVLWQQTYDAPQGNVTITFGGADPTAGVFVEGIKETRQWVGYNLTTGKRLWGPVGNQSEWDYFGNPAYTYTADQLAYGKLYSSAYGGIVYCYDLTSGKLLWTYGNGGAGNTTRTGVGVPAYGGYPTYINAVGNGVVYTVTTEHTVETPIYKGALARAIDATTGKELWTLSDYTGEFGGMSYAIADGYAVFFNGYDDQLYCVGKGISALTVSAPSTGLAFGTPVVIKGTLTDISAGTKQDQVAMNFPNGVPLASDSIMKDWMGFIYQQKPCPSNFVGVPVVLSVFDSNNNTRTIGTAMTDASGAFSLTWTPDIPGNFQIIASSAGTNSYWPSYSEDSFTVMQAPPTPQPPAPTVVEQYFVPATVAIIVVIIMVGIVLAVLTIRKKQ